MNGANERKEGKERERKEEDYDDEDEAAEKGGVGVDLESEMCGRDGFIMGFLHMVTDQRMPPYHHPTYLLYLHLHRRYLRLLS